MCTKIDCGMGLVVYLREGGAHARVSMMAVVIVVVVVVAVSAVLWLR